MIDYKEKYEQMMKRTASYSMGICAMIRKVGGESLLRSILDLSAENSGTRRATALMEEANPQNALANDLMAMLEEFNTLGNVITIEGNSVKVTNPSCGCLPPFTSQAEKFGFTDEEARLYACRRCMPSYKETVERIGLKFEGRLIGGVNGGCWMQFSKKHD